MDIIREVATRKVATHLRLTLLVKKLKISVEQSRVVGYNQNIRYPISCIENVIFYQAKSFMFYNVRITY